MILIFGGNGYVGGAFGRYFERASLPYRLLSRRDVDCARSASVRNLLKESRPEFVINCAGYTGKPNVDACEAHKAECLEGNAVLPAVLREVLREFDIPWGHVSSGCIFTGHRQLSRELTLEGFREEDAPNFSFRQNNCSFYSGTKALGEEALGYHEEKVGTDPALRWVGDADPEFYIWRLRIPFSEVDSSRNYLSKLMRYRKLLEVRNSLSQLDEFVRSCWECWEHKVPRGIYNVTNPGSVTTREVTELILAESAKRKRCGEISLFPEKFDFFQNEEEFMRVAVTTPRSSCVLDCSKLNATGIRMTPVAEAIEKALGEWRAES